MFKISVPCESEEVNEIRQEIDKKLKVEEIRNVININHVRETFSRLKNGKSGGEEGMCSDHVINGTNSLIVWLTCLFNCMLIHGVSPAIMSCTWYNGSHTKGQTEIILLFR